MGERSWQDVLGVIGSIPERMCEGEQPELLYGLSRSLRGRGEIVEIGTCAGKSTIALAFGQMEMKGRRVHTIDISEHPKFRENITKAGVGDWIVPIVGRSSHVARTWREPIELLWIDADHRHRGILSDIRHWGWRVLPGGYIALHDYPGFAGLNETHRAVYGTLLREPLRWRIVSDRIAGSIIVFQRMEDGSPRASVRDRLRARKKNLAWYVEELRARLRSSRR